MKFAVSNIAWDNSALAEHLALLRETGCQGVELAPSAIWPEPVDASAAERSTLRRMIEDNDLELAGFHALLFTRPDLQLFLNQASRVQTIDYLIGLAQVCSDLGGGVMVLGSPRNRVCHGRPYAECWRWAADACHQIAEAIEPLGVVLCIEPLGSDETEFLTSCREGGELVRSVDHAAFRLHLDAKALFSTGEDIGSLLAVYGDLLRHFHAGDPGLAPPGSTGRDHSRFGDALRHIGYKGYVSIEMRRDSDDSRQAVARSVAYVKHHYGGSEMH